MSRKIEVFERLWQRLPRPLRFPIQVAIETLQRKSPYRRWLQRQIDEGLIAFQFAEHPSPWISREYGLPCEGGLSALAAHRLTAYRHQQLIARGDLLLFRPPTSPRAWLFGIWVHPLFRRGTMGSEIVRRLLAKARQFSLPEVALAVEIGNSSALHFYKKLGFVPASVQLPPGFAPGDFCQPMVRTLSLEEGAE